MQRKLLYQLSILFALIGLIDSIYLTALHYDTAIPLACPDKGIINCENVLTSQYALILGVPIAVLGLVFFIAELLVIVVIKSKDAFIMLSGIGLAFVVYFIYTEYLIGNICLYCTLSHICTLALFILAIMQEKE